VISSLLHMTKFVRDKKKKKKKKKNFNLLLWEKKFYQESVEKGYDGISKMVLGSSSSSSSSWWTWELDHHHLASSSSSSQIHHHREGGWMLCFFGFGGKSRCEDLIFVQMFPGIWLLLRLWQSFIGSLSLSAITITQSAANVFQLSVK